MWWHNPFNTGNNGSRKATYRNNSPAVDHWPFLADSQTAQHGQSHSHRLAGQRLDAHQPRNLNTQPLSKNIIFMDFQEHIMLLPVLRIRNWDPGSGAFLTPGSGMGTKSGTGSGMKNLDHISDCLETGSVKTFRIHNTGCYGTYRIIFNL